MQKLEQSPLHLGHGTHPGETGKNNEDSYALAFFRAPDGAPLTLGMIADGIGGNRAGEVASALVTQIVVDSLASASGTDYRAMLELALATAAFAVAEKSKQPDFYGMGSTCAAALIAGNRLYTATIGDSRVYLMRGGIIRQTSVDHTWVQEAIEVGVITREEARTHPSRHVVRRHLGKDPSVKPDFRLRLYEGESPKESEHNQGLKLEPGSAVLICSDGLSDLVEPDEILEHVTRQETQLAVDELIALARARGGHDNITVVLMEIP